MEHFEDFQAMMDAKGATHFDTRHGGAVGVLWQDDMQLGSFFRCRSDVDGRVGYDYRRHTPVDLNVTLVPPTDCEDML